MNLFIDTNIYLAFYHYTSENLEQLKKLIVAIDNKEIRLFITRQVIDEFNRNREGKIADALKNVNNQNINNQFPLIFQEYDEFKLLKDALNKYDECKKQIMQKLGKDIAEKKLKADSAIKDLFNKAEVLKSSDGVLATAKLRMDLGNPPGKNNSYGDAINWEILIANAPNEDLYLIAQDNDYSSPMNVNQMNDFLLIEWEEKKKSKINLYKELSKFFKKEYPKIELNVEVAPIIPYAAASTLYNHGKVEIVDNPTAEVREGTLIFQYIDMNNNGQFDPGEPYWILNPPRTDFVIPPAGVIMPLED